MIDCKPVAARQFYREWLERPASNKRLQTALDVFVSDVRDSALSRNRMIP
jgi:hypothetical protein